MNTLVRSTTLAFSRRSSYYQVLDQSSSKKWGDHGRSRRTSSKRKKESPHMATSFSYRRDRAKKRQIFLQSYKLASVDSRAQSTSRKLKKMIMNLKSVVVSIVAFTRIASLRSCNTPAAICTSTPRPGVYPMDIESSHMNSAPPYPPKYVALAEIMATRQASGHLRIVVPSPVTIPPTIIFYAYTFYQPKIPSYKVDRLDIGAFDIQVDFSLYTEFVVTVIAEKPEREDRYYLWEGQCSRWESEFGSGLQEALMDNRHTGRIPLTIRVTVPVSLMVSEFRMKQFVVQVNCSLVVDSLSPKKKVGILSSKYDWERDRREELVTDQMELLVVHTTEYHVKSEEELSIQNNETKSLEAIIDVFDSTELQGQFVIDLDIQSRKCQNLSSAALPSSSTMSVTNVQNMDIRLLILSVGRLIIESSMEENVGCSMNSYAGDYEMAPNEVITDINTSEILEGCMIENEIIAEPSTMEQNNEHFIGDNVTFEDEIVEQCKVIGSVKNYIPKVGMEFETEKEAHAFYNYYAMKEGFGIKIKSSHVRKSTQELCHVLFACCKEGFTNRIAITQYSRPDTRTGCKARLRVKLTDYKKWRVTEVNIEHNHQVTPRKARFYKSHKHLDAGSKRRLELNNEAGIRFNKSYHSLVVDAGGYEKLSFGEKECRNHIDRVRRRKLAEGDATALHQFFCRMQ
ncbi:hypothetical protein HHK36_032504 [Tetracentron sinense]|uniref:FAR1 domain-containing protein n=1 Tax=Tetracentron sinense TaxID=13715 RepID=A0A834Y4Y9_TETSI|nr:hypothetical protein HHK36_032504 [Tetracentron sinense]